MSRKQKFTLFDFIVYAIATFLLIIFLPKGFNLAGYKAVFGDTNIMTGYANTIFYTVFGTIINLFVTLPAGYALTKKIPAHGFITGIIMFTMYFGGGMIPTFLWLNQ